MSEPTSLSSNSSPPAKKQKDLHGGTTNISRGKSHTDHLQRRKQIKQNLAALPSHQRAQVLSHYHGGGRSGELHSTRLRNLRQDDKNADISNLSSLQARNLSNRRLKPNMALQRQMSRRETKRLENAMSAADAEDILHTHTAGLVEVDNDMEKTVQLTQRQLKNEHLEEQVARNIYDLELGDYGPYKMNYDRSGRYSILAGQRGHVSIIDQHSLALKTEFFVQEKVRDAIFLHNGSMMAVAQEKNVYVYDEEGVEVHRLDGHRRVFGMEFLPYHWLLDGTHLISLAFSTS
eukprot:scaffold2510_cov215-Alexandrium_tamarense.AAC.9